MNAPDLYNPYAPPQAGAPGAGWQPPQQPYPAAHAPVPGIGEALRRLQEHVAYAPNLEQDKRVAGRRVPLVAWVLTGLGAVAFMGGIVWMVAASGSDAGVGIGASLGLGFVFLLIGGIVVGRNLMLVRRDAPSSPEKTLKSFLSALVAARDGYAWATLAPTAREQTVYVPNLAPVKTTLGVYPLRGEADMKAYATSFVRTSGSVVRVTQVKKVVLGSVEGDVARVSAELHFASWPRWVSILTGVGFIVFRPLVLLGAILIFATRKRHKARITKTMLRAQNGVWYVYDGDVLEGGVAI